MCISGWASLSDAGERRSGAKAMPGTPPPTTEQRRAVKDVLDGPERQRLGGVYLRPVAKVVGRVAPARGLREK